MIGHDRILLKCSIAFLVLMTAGRGGQASYSCSEYDKSIQCEEIGSLKDVATAVGFLRKYPDAETIDISRSNLDLLPNDVFRWNIFKVIRFWFCRMKEMPHRLINPVCGNVERITFYESKIDSETLPAGGFQECKKLQNLFLNKNGIRTVSPNAFQGLINLEKLYMNGNKIKRLDKGALNGLHNLKSLLLVSGELESLEEGVFDPISTTITKVYLAGNPLHCDCSLQWLQDWLRNQVTKKPNFRRYTYGALLCHTPMRGDLETKNFCNKTATSLQELKPDESVKMRADMLAMMLEMAHCIVLRECRMDNIFPKLWSTIKAMKAIKK